METKDKLYYLCINEMDFLISEQKLLLDRYLIKNRYYLYKSREEKQNLKSIFNRVNKGETKMVKKFYELEAGKIYKVEGKGYYKLRDTGSLWYKATISKENRWIKSNIEYNDLIAMTFKEYDTNIVWSKVPRGTQVQVRNDENEKLWTNTYLIDFNENDDLPYRVSKHKDDIYTGYKMEDNAEQYKYCRLFPYIELKKEWLVGDNNSDE